MSVVRALGRESWLQTVDPVPTINPLALTSRASQRVRATARRVDKEKLSAIVQVASRFVRAGATAEPTEPSESQTKPNKDEPHGH